MFSSYNGAETPAFMRVGGSASASMGCGDNQLHAEASWLCAIAHLSPSFLLFPLLARPKRRVLCRLRHSSSLERDGLPTGTFPTEWPGSRQERHAWVKHSWSIKRSSSGMLEEDGPLVRWPYTRLRFRDASRCEAKAVTPFGEPNCGGA